MPHGSFKPAPYKLIPFDPVPFFLAIACLAIVVNLLVLLGVLAKNLKPNMAEEIKKLVLTKRSAREKCPCHTTQRCVDGDYEMDISVGSSAIVGKLPQRTALGDEVRDEAAFLGGIWGPGGAAMRDSMR
jgi:hypothetical protein